VFGKVPGVRVLGVLVTIGALAGVAKSVGECLSDRRLKTFREGPAEPPFLTPFLLRSTHVLRAVSFRPAATPKVNNEDSAGFGRKFEGAGGNSLGEERVLSRHRISTCAIKTDGRW